MIATPRLLLRPMRAEDAAELLYIFGDTKVMASFGSAPFDHTQMDQWVQRNLAHQARHGYGLFSVILKTSGLLVGDCGLEHMEVDGVQAAELGYDFRSDYWNQGLATEAATAVRDYAFQVLKLPRLISLICHDNIASQRVAEKVGMRRDRALTRYDHAYWMYILTHEACPPCSITVVR